MPQKTHRPGSHWWLISGIIIAALGVLIAMVESARPGEYHSMVGFALLCLGGFLFSVGVLVELFLIASAVRRIETQLKTPAKPTGEALTANPPAGSKSQPKNQTVS